MPVAVMHVGGMRMLMAHRLVAMGMGVWLAGWIVRAMTVLVVHIVGMRMGMRHDSVLMVMRVIFGQVQPDAQTHEESCGDQLRGDWLAQDDNCSDCSQEWRGREVGARAGRAEMAER